MCCNNDGYFELFELFSSRFLAPHDTFAHHTARGGAAPQLPPGVGGRGWPLVHFSSQPDCFGRLLTDSTQRIAHKVYNVEPKRGQVASLVGGSAPAGRRRGEQSRRRMSSVRPPAYSHSRSSFSSATAASKPCAALSSRYVFPISTCFFRPTFQGLTRVPDHFSDQHQRYTPFVGYAGWRHRSRSVVSDRNG